MSEASSSPKRPRLDFDESNIKDDHYDKYSKNRDQDDQSCFSQSKLRKCPDLDDEDGREEEGKSKSMTIETARREHTLVMRLTNKEQELQDCMNQIQEMKQAQTQNTAQLRSMLLDPAINLVFQRMAREMDEHKEKLKQKQNELSAWKFTPDSQTGMRLMAKCRMLLQENGDLGKMISSGRTARLEGEIALHKALVTEMKKNQKELDEFVGELEEDVEGMQGMIFMLQQQLKEAREQISRLQQENEQLRTLRMPPDPEPGGEAENPVSSNSNTPKHPWLDPVLTPAHSLEPDSTASKLMGASILRTNSLDHLGKKSLPTIIPPALSAMSCTFKGAASSDQLSVAQSSDEDFNCGESFVFKVTPDSGSHTQEEEDTSMDTAEYTEYTASPSNHEHPFPKQLPDLSLSDSKRTAYAEYRSDNSSKLDEALPQAGLAIVESERTSSHTSDSLLTSAPQNNATHAENAPTTQVSSSDSCSSRSPANPSVSPGERSLHTVPQTCRTTPSDAICTSNGSPDLTHRPEECSEADKATANSGRNFHSSSIEPSSTIVTDLSDDKNVESSDDKSTLHLSLGHTVGIKEEENVESPKLVNGSANLTAQQDL